MNYIDYMDQGGQTNNTYTTEKDQVVYGPSMSMKMVYHNFLKALKDAAIQIKNSYAKTTPVATSQSEFNHSNNVPTSDNSRKPISYKDFASTGGASGFVLPHFMDRQ